MFVRSVITGLGVADADLYQHMTPKERVEVTEETLGPEVTLVSYSLVAIFRRYLHHKIRMTAAAAIPTAMLKRCII
jgi:hypothetical protein